VLVMVFLVDLVEDRLLFRSEHIPPWGKVAIKMAVIVGLLGILLGFVNRRIDGGVSTAHALSGRVFVPRIATHALLIGAVFIGFFWLKIGRLPWE